MIKIKSYKPSEYSDATATAEEKEDMVCTTPTEELSNSETGNDITFVEKRRIGSYLLSLNDIVYILKCLPTSEQGKIISEIF